MACEAIRPTYSAVNDAEQRKDFKIDDEEETTKGGGKKEGDKNDKERGLDIVKGVRAMKVNKKRKVTSNDDAIRRSPRISKRRIL